MCAFLSVCVYVNLRVCMHKCVFFSECASRHMFSISEQSYQGIHLCYVLYYKLTLLTAFVLVFIYSNTYDMQAKAIGPTEQSYHAIYLYYVLYYKLLSLTLFVFVLKYSYINDMQAKAISNTEQSYHAYLDDQYAGIVCVSEREKECVRVFDSICVGVLVCQCVSVLVCVWVWVWVWVCVCGWVCV